ncbi:hypothetical protein [Maribacter sp. 2307ULW6-5]
MERQLTFGTKMLNAFLKIMVACLIGILIAIPVALVLQFLNII